MEKYRRMKTLFSMIILSAIVLATGCKKSNNGNNNGSTSRKVKYELTGNFVGQIFFVTSDNVNGNETETISALPWSKEKTYASEVQAFGVGGQAASASAGQAGHTVTVKLYVGGVLVRSGTSTADANGIISLPALAYTF